MMNKVNVLEPNDPNMDFRRTTMYIHIRNMNGDDAEMMLEDLSRADRTQVSNFVKHQLKALHNMHPNIIVKDVRMGDDEFEMSVGNTIKDEDFEVTEGLVTEFFSSETVQKEFPKIDGKQYKVMVELE